MIIEIISDKISSCCTINPVIKKSQLEQEVH